MSPQSEQALEEKLIKNLEALEYVRVEIPDEAALVQNLRTQLGFFNQVEFTDKEFKKVLNHLNQ